MKRHLLFIMLIFLTACGNKNNVPKESDTVELKVTTQFFWNGSKEYFEKKLSNFGLDKLLKSIHIQKNVDKGELIIYSDFDPTSVPEYTSEKIHLNIWLINLYDKNGQYLMNMTWKIPLYEFGTKPEKQKALFKEGKSGLIFDINIRDLRDVAMARVNIIP